MGQHVHGRERGQGEGSAPDIHLVTTKFQASEIRTLMKIKGLWYPEVQGRTKSAFVTNKYHHLVSFATMFGPSPDW